MIQSAITVSLVEEARGGPFVLWDGLDAAFETARSLGFDAVEIFAPGPEAVDRSELHRLVEATGLQVAAVGTGIQSDTAARIRPCRQVAPSAPASQVAPSARTRGRRWPCSL